MTPEFHRIRRLPPYVFEEVNRIKARLRAELRAHYLAGFPENLAPGGD